MSKEVYENRRPFCNGNWKPLAIFLVAAVLTTFGWGFFVLSDFYDNDEEFFNPMSAGFFQAAFKTKSRFGAITSATLVTVCATDQGMRTGLKMLGAGIIVNPDGYIVSANHLVNSVKNIVVQVNTVNGVREYPVEIVKMNKSHDLVLLKIISRDIFPFMPLDETQTLKQGDPVFAFGTQAAGVLTSGKGVVDTTGVNVNLGNINLTDLLQTSAVKDWSFSGGPLLNNDGVMVGLNIAIQTPDGRVSGYAVPSHIVIGHFQDIVQFMTTTANVDNSLAGVQSTQNGTNMRMRENALAAVPVNQNIPAQVSAGGVKTGRPSEDWWGAAEQSVNSVNNPENEFEAQKAVGGPQGMNAAMVSPVTVDSDPAHTSKGRIFGYTIGSAIGLLVLGLFTGISGGMMTMGGGIIKVTGLILFFGYGTLLIRPVAYITNVFLYGASSLRYKRNNLIQLEHVRRLIPWAMGGIVIGYFLGNYLGNRLIEILLGGFAFFMGCKILMEIFQFGDLEESEALKDARQETDDLSYDVETSYMADQRGAVSASLLKDGLLGVPMGIVSGILGISGGVIEVPLQRYAANVPLKNAIANSSVMVFFASLVGSILSMVHGISIGAFEWNTPVMLALFLIPGAYAGGMIGAWLTQQVSLLVLRWVYAVLMFAIALRMLIL